MAVFIGAVKSKITAKDLINMGRFTQEKNDNRISITYDMGQYDVRGFIDGKRIWESFDRFGDAIKTYKSLSKKL
jgi:hypothetical protein